MWTSHPKIDTLSAFVYLGLHVKVRLELWKSIRVIQRNNCISSAWLRSWEKLFSGSDSEDITASFRLQLDRKWCRVHSQWGASYSLPPLLEDASKSGGCKHDTMTILWSALIKYDWLLLCHWSWGLVKMRRGNMCVLVYVATLFVL